jgi:predicted CXXCH cytochrome family protein
VKRKNLKRTVAALLAFVTVSILAFSCATIDRVIVAPPMIPGAKYVGMEVCAPCHEKEVKDFKLAAHARVTIVDSKDEKRGKREGQGCESCHGPGSLHVEAGGERGKFIINPSKNPEACFQCHLDKQAEFSLQYHHPVKEGRMTCTTCHNPHGHDLKLGKGMHVGRVNENCSQCHREQTRPHVFEHPALREGCTTCHAVHGSINPKMLLQRDNNLCMKCHSQPQVAAGALVIGRASQNHATRVTTGTCFTAGCHTAIHGSNLSPALRY